MEQKHCYVFVGGEDIYIPAFDKDFFDGGDLIIAADAGCDQIERLNMAGIDIAPDVILGDFDSIVGEAVRLLFPNAKMIKYPPEKDFTDTQLALSEAVKMGCTDISVIGGTGGRTDHYLANLALLRLYRKKGITVSIFDGKNLISYKGSGRTVIKDNGTFKYFSIIPDSQALCGVTISGAKYNVSDAEIDGDMPVSVSNEFFGSECSITVDEGEYFLILCRE